MSEHPPNGPDGPTPPGARAGRADDPWSELDLGLDEQSGDAPLPAPLARGIGANADDGPSAIDLLFMRDAIGPEDSVHTDGRPPEPAVDPWAHRRGEPRVFAFFWTFYVLLAVAGSLTWVARYTAITASSYGPAARIMLVVVAVGMIVLWPMTRLSQASPRAHPALAAVGDFFVVQAPVQIIIWPLIVLANWPSDIVIGLAAMFAAWGVLVGGLVALALAGREVSEARDARLYGRTGWMVVALALGFGAVAVQAALIATGVSAPPWLRMSSPVTAIPALTGHGLSGPSAPVSQAQWQTIVGTLSVAVLLWSASIARYGLATRPRNG